MQTYQIRAIPRACKPLTTVTAPQSARAMGTFFPHFPSHPFALLSRDFDSLFPSESWAVRPQHQLRPFVPKADVREDGAAYTLGLELPGLKQEDISIEFVDANTLVIAGKTERASTQTNAIDTKGKGKAIEGASSPNTVTTDNASDTSSNHHKATVEDEYVDAGAEKEGASTTAPTAAAADPTEVSAAPEQPESKYWVSERSVGEFSRTFSFPGKVDQEAVKASLKNGILSVVVPKAAKQQRKIAIE
ncbi:MAG: hypothetical protein LQ339_006322 [Xanthoria mediterranea]|nr:MAG: hypothetical protein LQ339_006322 [Xanthoria mediterranea]